MSGGKEISSSLVEKTQSYLVVIPPSNPETSFALGGLQFIFRHLQGVGGGRLSPSASLSSANQEFPL